MATALTLRVTHFKLSGALWRVLSLLVVSVFINYIDRGSLSIAAPLLKDELGLSPAELGLLLSAFFWTYAPFQIVSGWLVDRFEVTWVLAGGFFLWSVATAAGTRPNPPPAIYLWRCYGRNEYFADMKCVILIVLLALSTFAQSTPPPAADTKPSKSFDEVADSALAAMTKRAQELKIHGAAVVAFIEGDVTQSWSSKMVIVGSMKDAPTEKSHGNNLLAIAYAKAAEMAETLKDSGHAGRPPMTGETGWQGGLIKKGKTGYLIAAFSGGPSESDLKVSQAGLEVLSEKL